MKRFETKNFMTKLMSLSRKHNVRICEVLNDAFKLEEAGITNIPEELDKYYESNKYKVEEK